MAALKAHEAALMPIAYRYGGQLISASHPSAPKADDPDEIQIFQFPDLNTFEVFRKDPELSSYKELRAQAIREARIFITDQFITYLD